MARFRGKFPTMLKISPGNVSLELGQPSVGLRVSPDKPILRVQENENGMENVEFQ